jgi:hypothetical protein
LHSLLERCRVCIKIFTSICGSLGRFRLLGIGCSRSLKHRRLCQLLVGFYCVKQKYMQSSQSNTRLSIQVHSLAEMHQLSTALDGHTKVNVIWSNISSSKSAAGTSCSASKPTSSCSHYVAVTPFLARCCATGQAVRDGLGVCRKRKEFWLTPRFLYSTSNSECARGDATCLCSMHC